MKINYDYEQLADLIKHFYIVTGVPVCIFDVDYKPIIAYPPSAPPLCSLIKSSPEGNKGCIDCDVIGCKKAQASGTTVTYECHAGLRDTVTPINHNGNLLGFIMFGQIADDRLPPGERLSIIIEKCKKYNLKKEEIEAAFKETRFCEESFIESSSKIASACVSYIFLSNLIKIKDVTIFENIKNYLHFNYSEDITIKTICDNFYISKSKLFNLIKNHSDTTPMDYLKNIRIKEFKHLLVSTDIPVSEISGLVGVSDFNYMIKIFKKETGVSPLRYRKMHQEQEKE